MRGSAVIVVRKHFLDHLSNEDLHELREFLGGNADLAGGVVHLTSKVWRNSETFLAELLPDECKSDLALPDVIHH